MKRVLKRLARVLFGDYAVYHILTRARGAASIPAARLPDDLACGPVQLTQLESCEDPAIRDQAFYFGDGARGWACMDRGGRIMGLCIYWYGDRYRDRGGRRPQMRVFGFEIGIKRCTRDLAPARRRADAQG